MRISDWSSDVCSSDLSLASSACRACRRARGYWSSSSRATASPAGWERSASPSSLPPSPMRCSPRRGGASAASRCRRIPCDPPVMSLPADHPPVAAPRVGVLLVNLGTPDAPDARSVRRYLAQFLSDRRVVEIPQILWQPILRGIILTTRPKKSAHAYAQIWTDEGSPLAAITRAQSDALPRALGDRIGRAHV